MDIINTQGKKSLRYFLVFVSSYDKHLAFIISMAVASLHGVYLSHYVLPQIQRRERTYSHMSDPTHRNTHAHTQRHTHTHTETHTNTHTQKHTETHTHTHTQTHT